MWSGMFNFWYATNVAFDPTLVGHNLCVVYMYSNEWLNKYQVL